MSFRTIPTIIGQKLQQIKNRYIVVAVVKNIKESDIRNYQHLGIKMVDGQVSFAPRVITPATSGVVSRENLTEKEIIRKDLPKVPKEIYLGMRPIYGDWSNGSFPLFQTRQVYLREFQAARKLS